MTPVHAPNTDVVYFHHDRLGSVAALTQNGKTLLSRVFRPFGSVRGSSGTTPVHYAFTGKERDSKTGLDDFGARFYDATLSHWISADPLALTQAAAMLGGVDRGNVFSYVGNRPTTLRDPTGLKGFWHRFWQGFKKSLHSGVGNAIADVKAHPDRYTHATSIVGSMRGIGGRRAQQIVKGVVASTRGAVPLAEMVKDVTMLMVGGVGGTAGILGQAALSLVVAFAPAQKRSAVRRALDRASKGDKKTLEAIDKVVDVVGLVLSGRHAVKNARELMKMLREHDIIDFRFALARLGSKFTAEERAAFKKSLEELTENTADIQKDVTSAVRDKAREEKDGKHAE